MARRQIVHIHIPKTAGTSITTFMRRLVGAKNVGHFSRRDKTRAFRQMSDDDLRKFRCVGGHIPFDTLHPRLGDDPFYFTVLREPGEWFASFYKDVLSREQHPLHETASTMSPVGFLDHVYTNGKCWEQTRYLALDGSVDEAVERVASGRIAADTLPNVRRLLERVARAARRCTAAADPGEKPVTAESLPHVNAGRRAESDDLDSLMMAARARYEIDVRLYEAVEKMTSEAQ